MQGRRRTDEERSERLRTTEEEERKAVDEREEGEGGLLWKEVRLQVMSSSLVWAVEDVAATVTFLFISFFLTFLRVANL